MRKHNTKSFAPTLLLIVLLIIPLTFAALNLPAPAFAASCAEDVTHNLLKNGTMAPAAPNSFGVVSKKWRAFVVGANVPHFENASNEGYDPNGSQFIWADLVQFDAGIYQKVQTLTAGQTYHFWIVWGQTQHDLQGNLQPATLINRQIGIDPTGGTDPTAPTVKWSVPYYGGSGFNRPEWNLTFTTLGTTATFFLRAQNFHTDGRNKIFFDTACLYPANGAATSTPWTPTLTPTITPTRSTTLSPTPSPTPNQTVTKYDDTNTALTYHGAWTAATDSHALNGTFHYARGVKGAEVTASLPFSGNAVQLWYLSYRNRGKARVFIDGVKVGVIDQYSTSLQFNRSKTFGGLADGPHTLTLKNSGGKNPAAIDSIITLDEVDAIDLVASSNPGIFHNAGFVTTPQPKAHPPATTTPAPRRYIPFGAASPVAPTPADPSVKWDARLPGLNVSLQPANVAPGTLYWKLVRADYDDPFQHCGDFGADHDMYYVLTNESGGRVTNQKVWQSWPDDSTSALTDLRGIADIAIWANYFPSNGPGPYNGWVDGLPSDVVSGMGLPANNHVSFILYFKKTVASAFTPRTPTPTGVWNSPTPSPTATPDCSLSGTVTPTPKNQTPTRTPTPSNTPTATATPISSRTPTLTSVPTGTATFTRTFTPTQTLTPAPTSSACAFAIVATTQVGAAPKGIAVDPATGRVFVGLAASSAVAVLDGTTHRLLGTWQTDGVGNTNGVAFANNQVFVTKRNTANVSVINAADGTFVKNIVVGDAPYGIGASGNRVWVANFDDGTVTLIDAATDAVVKTSAVGTYPSLVAPMNDNALVSMWQDGAARVDGSNALLNTFATGAGTFGIAADANRQRIYISNRTSQLIRAYNAATNALAKSITDTDVPYALAVNPNTNHLFTVNADRNRVSVRNATNFKLFTYLNVGAQGENGGDTIGVLGNEIYVGNNADGTVSVLRDCADATLPPTPPAPTPAACVRRPKLVAPASGEHVSSQTPQLDWNTVACATRYNVQVRKDTVNGKLVADTSTTDSDYTTHVLKRHKPFYWRVSACNAQGCGGWTAWRKFYVD